MYFTAHTTFFNVCTIYSIKKKNLFGESGLLLKAAAFSSPSTSDMTSVLRANCVGSHLGNLASCTVPHAISVSWMHQSVAQFWHLYPSHSYPNYTGNKRHSSLSSFHLLPALSVPSPLLTSIFSTTSNISHSYCVDNLHTTFDDPLSRSGWVCVRFGPAHSTLMHTSASQMLEALWPQRLRCEWIWNLQMLSLTVAGR